MLILTVFIFTLNNFMSVDSSLFHLVSIGQTGFCLSIAIVMPFWEHTENYVIK